MEGQGERILAAATIEILRLVIGLQCCRDEATFKMWVILTGSTARGLALLPVVFSKQLTVTPLSFNCRANSLATGSSDGVGIVMQRAQRAQDASQAAVETTRISDLPWSEHS